MNAKTFSLPDTLTSGDMAFIKRLMTPRATNKVITVNGREIQVIRGTSTPQGDLRP